MWCLMKDQGGTRKKTKKKQLINKELVEEAVIEEVQGLEFGSNNLVSTSSPTSSSSTPSPSSTDLSSSSSGSHSSSESTPRSNLEQLLSSFQIVMKRVFEITDFGVLQYFLCLEVKQRKQSIFVCQEKYARDMLKKFQMEDCEAAINPMNTNEKSLVVGLNYLTHTRHDIAYSVSVVSRYMHSPSRQHLGAAKRIFRYVAGTVEYGIWYEPSESFKLIGQTDSDWAGCLDDKRSTSGSSSKKQDIVALEQLLSSFQIVMKRVFEITDFGVLQYFLGLEVKQRKQSIFVCQEKYARDMLKKFQMEDCEAAINPMNTNEKLQRED
ncbi:hypothetical protein V2J09_017805 [Rumex salicifolius]